MTSISTQPKRGELLHILGATFGIAVAVGAMIGVGILRAPASIARDVPDIWLILALWAVGLIHAGLEANVIAELGTTLPRAGGPYVYVHRAFGDIAGLIVGWTLWMQRLAAIAALSVAFADFLALIWPAAGNALPAIAVAMQLAMFGMNYFGLREGRAIQESTSFLKGLVLIGFCIAAFVIIAPFHATAVTTPRLSSLIGFGGLVAAYQLIVGAYAGWYEPAFFSEECADSGRSLPRVMGVGLLLTAILYIGVNGALLHALGPQGVAQSTLPFTTVLARIGGAYAGMAVALFAIVSVASCSNAAVMSAPRVLLALSRDRLLPAAFQNVNKGGSPTVAIAVTAAGTIAVALSGSFTLAFGLIATLQAAAFILVILSLFVLRRREPDLVRPFRAIGYPFLPAIVLMIDFGLLLLFLNANWMGGLYAGIMWLLCIPFALIARRARRLVPVADAV
ncbi:MAG TPA: APC family permease [Rhizomicrobium sp.]|jgi:APA family basic amino acid/polyamine antiporter